MEVVVNGRGSKLRCREGAFVIKHEDDTRVISPLMVSRLTLATSCSTSTDAIKLAVEHQIPVSLTDTFGNPFCLLWSRAYGSISTIRKNQVYFSDALGGGEWARDILAAKTRNQAGILRFLANRRPSKRDILVKASAKIMDAASRLQSLEVEQYLRKKASWRGIEGQASRVYFETLAAIVPSAYHFKSRSKFPAKDRFNCLLNYGYGMLYARMEIALIKAGVDPYIGVIHRNQYNKPALVFDIIELFRAWIDKVVIDIVMRQEFLDGDFQESASSCVLTESGRERFIPVLNQYMAEVVQFSRKRRTRFVHIDLYGQKFAQKMLKNEYVGGQ